MHSKCNRDRGGQVTGYPRFECNCHYQQIVGDDLWVYYRSEGGTVRRRALRGVVHNATLEEIEQWKREPPGASRLTVLPVRYSKNQQGYYRRRGGHVYAQIPSIFVPAFNSRELRRVGLLTGGATAADRWLDAFRAKSAESLEGNGA